MLTNVTLCNHECYIVNSMLSYGESHQKNYQKFLILKYIFLLLFLLSTPVFAQCDTEDDECVAVDQWQFSLATGVGVITNPLNGGKNIPLVLIPNVSYYGEKFFLENSVVGYSLHENNKFSFSVISQVNRENAFFSRWHPSNILIANSSHELISDNSTPPSDTTDKSAVDLDEVEDRKWALDGGLQVNWFLAKDTDIKAQVLHDINGVYNGFNGQVEINHFLRFQQLERAIVKLTLGGNWQSSEQVDYYYGINKQDDPSGTNLYQGVSSFSPYIKLFGYYHLTKNWAVRVNLSREFLSNSLTDSPLVTDKVVDTFFVGVAYAF